MHANRNKSAVKRVEKGMMKANRTRNLFAVFAIVLTTFMITTVFSLGINYMENMKLMQVRTAGTTADVSLAMPTAEQEQQIKDLEYVKTVGTQYMVGSVAEKNDEGRELSIAIQYYDTTEWEKHYQEAIKDLEGKYPASENEIMLSEDALSQLGITDPKLNMEIPLSYYDKNGQQEKTFTLSGWFHSYTGSCWYEQRHFQQSLYYLGQIQKEMVSVLPAPLFPVPSHADGRRTRRRIFEELAKRD